MSKKTLAEIEKAISEIIVRDLEVNIKAEDILATGKLDELFGLDSVAIIELVLSIEKEFNIRIPVEELTIESFKNIKTTAEHVYQRL